MLHEDVEENVRILGRETEVLGYGAPGGSRTPNPQIRSFSRGAIITAVYAPSAEIMRTGTGQQGSPVRISATQPQPGYLRRLGGLPNTTPQFAHPPVHKSLNKRAVAGPLVQKL